MRYSEREHELMTRARILALLQEEKSLLRKLPGLAGEEVDAAETRLAAVRQERGHLDALLRHDPKAIAAEAARLRQVDMDFERAVAARNQEALSLPHDGLPGGAAKEAVLQDLSALHAIESETVRFTALATMGSSAEEHATYRTALEGLAPNVANAVALAHAAVTHAWEVMQAERGAAIRRAEFAIADYVGSEQAAEYSYSDSFNPEGKPAAYFHEQASLARVEMMESLAALADDDAEAVLARKQAADHDGSTFAVSSMKEVRAYRAALTGRDDPEHAVSDTDRQAAAAAIGHKAAIQAARELQDAVSFGEEERFHGAFEAVRQHPTIDAIAVAKAVTGRDHATREQALGAIENAFYAPQQNQRQAMTRGAR